MRNGFVRALAVLGMIWAMILGGYPQTPSLLLAQTQGQFGGDVPYWVMAGRSGVTSATRNALTFASISPPSPFNFKTQTPTAVDVKFCLELGVVQNISVGVRAILDGVAMPPASSATTYDAGLLVHPAITAPQGNPSGLSTYCFNFQKHPVAVGTHTLFLEWALSAFGLAWARRYSLTVWAAKIKP